MKRQVAKRRRMREREREKEKMRNHIGRKRNNNLEIDSREGGWEKKIKQREGGAQKRSWQ